MKLDEIRKAFSKEAVEVQYLEEVCRRVNEVLGPVEGEPFAVALINFIALHSVYFTDGFVINDDEDLNKTIGYEMAAVAMAALCQNPYNAPELWKDIRLNFDTDDTQYNDFFETIYRKFYENINVDRVE